MPDISTARAIAKNLGADLPVNRLRLLHKQLTEYMRTSAGGSVVASAAWGSITGDITAQADLVAINDQSRTARFFLTE